MRIAGSLLRLFLYSNSIGHHVSMTKYGGTGTDGHDVSLFTKLYKIGLGETDILTTNDNRDNLLQQQRRILKRFTTRTLEVSNGYIVGSKARIGCRSCIGGGEGPIFCCLCVVQIWLRRTVCCRRCCCCCCCCCCSRLAKLSNILALTQGAGIFSLQPSLQTRLVKQMVAINISNQVTLLQWLEADCTRIFVFIIAAIVIIAITCRTTHFVKR
mmetsp:Transcript_5439/g.15315  ORF Transcript_5439/g.15315 Transcript_5439/m.15315 type:complete len:213 (+) Transcript_5439:214-852(+)